MVEQAGRSKNRVSSMFSAVCLVHSKKGTIAGAAPCPWQHAGFLMALQWLHNLPFPPLSHVRQLPLLHITGIYPEGYPAYCPGKPCSLWKWAVSWSSVTFSLGPIEMNLAEILQISGIRLLLILSFWYCHEVCYLGLILVRHR